MKHKVQIKKRILAMLLSVLFCFLQGCSAPSRQHPQKNQTLYLSMVVSSNAPQSVKEAASEFANRAAYYSGGELDVSWSESQQLGSVLNASDTEFAFVLNEELVADIPELKTLELPFYFKNADYQFSALNSQRTQKRLNELIGTKYPMQVQMAVACGYEDFAADATVDLTDFRKQYPTAVQESFFSDKIQQDIGAREIEAENPMGMLLDGEVEIAAAAFSQVIEAVESPSYQGKLAVLDSSRRIRTAYLLISRELMDTLTPRQQAAVEQAAVMACGYCHNLSDEQRKQELNRLQELQVEILPVNMGKYHAMMGDIYQYETDQLLYRPDLELDRLVRSDAVKETF